MGRGKAAYILKVISDLNGADLKTDITTKIDAHHINESINKKNRKGFINLNTTTEEISGDIPKLYHLDVHSSIRAVYREYVEEVDKYTHDIQYSPVNIDLLYDYNKRVLIVFSSSPIERNKILKLFNNTQGSIHFQQPRYADINNIEQFFRWLILNSKDHRDKFPQSCKLQNIEGVKVTKLERSARHSTSESASLLSVGHLIDDHLYEEVEDEGTREYIKCIFEHSRLAFKTSVYNNGKINLSSRPPNIDDGQYFSLFPIIFEEMENLYTYYLQDLGGVR